MPNLKTKPAKAAALKAKRAARDAANGVTQALSPKPATAIILEPGSDTVADIVTVEASKPVSVATAAPLAVSKPTPRGARPSRNEAIYIAGMREMRGRVPASFSGRDRAHLTWFGHQAVLGVLTVHQICLLGGNPLAPKMRGNVQISWPNGDKRFSDTDDIDLTNRCRHLGYLEYDNENLTVSLTDTGKREYGHASAGQFKKALAAEPVHAIEAHVSE